MICHVLLVKVVKEATEAFLSTGAGDAWRALAQQRLSDLSQTSGAELAEVRSGSYRSSLISRSIYQLI